MQYSKEQYEEDLKKIYQNILNYDGRGCPSYPICCESCKWQNERKLLPPTGAWVGDNYGESRILFLGINTNQGSKDSKSFWAPEKWYNSDREYLGRATNQIIKKVWDRKFNHNDSMNYYAFTNVIKCSVSEQSGAPTEVMSIRCPYIEQYLDKELKVLKPKVIFAFGETPFQVVQNLNMETVEEVSDNFKDWLFKYTFKNNEVFVCRLYNPGQGYRTPRNIWKRINGKGKIDNWMRFISNKDIKRNDIANHLESKYQKENGIDKANPFYDEMFHTLWNQISSFVKLKDN